MSNFTFKKFVQNASQQNIQSCTPYLNSETHSMVTTQTSQRKQSLNQPSSYELHSTFQQKQEDAQKYYDKDQLDKYIQSIKFKKFEFNPTEPRPNTLLKKVSIHSTTTTQKSHLTSNPILSKNQNLFNVDSPFSLNRTQVLNQQKQQQQQQQQFRASKFISAKENYLAQQHQQQPEQQQGQIDEEVDYISKKKKVLLIQQENQQEVQQTVKANPQMYSRFKNSFQHHELLEKKKDQFFLYKCQHVLDNSWYIIKIHQFKCTEDEKQELLSDVKIASKINQLEDVFQKSHFVKYHTSWIENEKLFVQYECMDKTLQKTCKSKQFYDEKSLKSLTNQICNQLMILEDKFQLTVDLANHIIFVDQQHNNYKMELVNNLIQISDNGMVQQKVNVYKLGLMLANLMTQQNLKFGNMEEELSIKKIIEAFAELNYSSNFKELVCKMLDSDPKIRPFYSQILYVIKQDSIDDDLKICQRPIKTNQILLINNFSKINQFDRFRKFSF